MSSSIYGLGSITDIFQIYPDFARNPTFGSESGRSIIQYNLAKTAVRSLTPNYGLKFSYGFMNIDKLEEFNLIDFFVNTACGRKNPFWIPVYDRRFQVIDKDSVTPAIENGDDWLRFKPCGFNDLFTISGIESNSHVFIILNNGDWITREIINSIPDTQGYEGIQIDNSEYAWVEDIWASEIAQCGILALCRFDQDELSMEHDTPFVSSCELSFKELVQEYAVL